MSEHKTYRVRVCEERILAINVSAPDGERARELADFIYKSFGSRNFDIIGGDIDRDTMEAEEISGADLPAEENRRERGRGGRSRRSVSARGTAHGR